MLGFRLRSGLFAGAPASESSVDGVLSFLVGKWGKMWEEEYCEKKRNWWSGGGCKNPARRTKYEKTINSRRETNYNAKQTPINAGNNLNLKAYCEALN
jgi:hypothetical protein